MNFQKPVLICAATVGELRAFGWTGAREMRRGRLWRIPEGYAAITGVGIPATLMRLPPLIAELRPHWILNLGIAGAYPGSGLDLGDVVAGITEVFADLGMELPEAEAFRPLSAFPFADPLTRGPLPLSLPSFTRNLPRGAGATVNACTGRESTGRLRRRLYGADFESMEGAAVALAGKAAGLKVCEIRAISNKAGRRDLRPENIALALQALRAFWQSRHPLA